LSTDYERRKVARQEGRRFCDPHVLTYQAERMSEPIRLKVGGVTNQQMTVYDEFGKTIPGFVSNNTSLLSSGYRIPTQAASNWPSDEMSSLFDRCIKEIDLSQQACTQTEPQTDAFGMPTSTTFAKLQVLLELVKSVRNSKEPSLVTPFVQKIVESLLDIHVSGTHPEMPVALKYRFRNCHLIVLRTLQDPRLYGSPYVSKEVTQILTNHREDIKFNVEVVELLIRCHLINVEVFDVYLAQSLERGMNFQSVQFAYKLLKVLFYDEKASAPITEAKFYNTLEVLAKVVSLRVNFPPMLPQLIETIKTNFDLTLEESQRPKGATQVMHNALTRVVEHERRVLKLCNFMGGFRKRAKEFDDPQGFLEKVEYFMREWVGIYHSPSAGRDGNKGFATFVQQLQLQKILHTDDLIICFFRNCTELFVDMTYGLMQDTNTQTLVNPSMIRSKCFHFLDAYVRLIVFMIKWPSGETSTSTRVHFLNRILGVTIGVLLHDHEARHTDFRQLAFQRIFLMLYFELTAPEQFLDNLSVSILTAFTNAFHLIRPSKAPGFAFAWLELVAYRGFLSKMLQHPVPPMKQSNAVNCNVPPTWPMYSQLLIDLFKYLSPYLRNVEITKSIEVLYRGTLRLILVLLHDFPEFLCNFHYTFCDVIPANCIQLRNLILSAFPRNMRLPDPFTPNLKVDTLPEINQAPIILTNICHAMPEKFSRSLETYLSSRAPVDFLSNLRSTLQVSNEAGCKYNVPLINSLVLYVGVQAIAHLNSKGTAPSMGTITHSSHMDIFQNLSVILDTEGRYLFLNAIANQLRYPNAHTHYFGCTLLYLFVEANQEAIQEQITRVLLERLIVNRPHPWGLLITFIELIKNPTYKFWTHEFVNCAPEITKLFESVARSCTGKQYSLQQNQATIPSITTSNSTSVVTGTTAVPSVVVAPPNGTNNIPVPTAVVSNNTIQS